MKKSFASICVVSILVFCFLLNFKFNLNVTNKKISNLEETEVFYRIRGPLRPNDSRLINYIEEHYLQPPSEKIYNLSEEVVYKATSDSSSWPFIHKQLENLFGNEPPGFFVESGALDGEYLSNSLWLEKDKGWKGLLVEPNPTSFAALTKKNRKSWIAHSCISVHNYPKSSVFSGFSPSHNQYERRLNSWFLRAYTFEHDNGLAIVPYDSQQEYITVQCFPLESFLFALNVTVVDFLSLDIQGGELEVLKNFPWDKITIRVMAVEYLVSLKNIWELSLELMEFMEGKGYALIGTTDAVDYFYVKKDDKLINKFKNDSFIDIHKIKNTQLKEMKNQNRRDQSTQKLR